MRKINSRFSSDSSFWSWSIRWLLAAWSSALRIHRSTFHKAPFEWASETENTGLLVNGFYSHQQNGYILFGVLSLWKEFFGRERSRALLAYDFGRSRSVYRDLSQSLRSLQMSLRVEFFQNAKEIALIEYRVKSPELQIEALLPTRWRLTLYDTWIQMIYDPIRPIKYMNFSWKRNFLFWS